MKVKKIMNINYLCSWPKYKTETKSDNEIFKVSAADGSARLFKSDFLNLLNHIVKSLRNHHIAF